MISIPLTGTLKCDEPGCTESTPVELCLMATGGFGFKPVDLESVKAWQVGASQNGAWLTYCAAHKKTVMTQQVGPAGRRLVEVKGGH